MKKFGISISLIVLAFPFMANSSACNCLRYEMPFYAGPGNNIKVYNREEGSLKNINLDDLNISDISNGSGLGSFIHKIVWSPNGEKIIMLAENVLPAKAVPKLYAKDRELNSLNWWLFDIRTGKSTLIPAGIMKIGWIDNDNVLFNYQNKSLRRGRVDNLSESTEIISELAGSNQPEESASPIALENKIIFPQAKGFYLINKDFSQPPKFINIGGKLLNISPDAISKGQFVIGTETGAIIFNEQGVEADNIKTAFNKPIFVGQEKLLGIKSDGLAYFYDIPKKQFERFEKFELMDPEYLFSLNGTDHILAITNEGGIYYLKNGNFMQLDESIVPDTAGNFEPDEISTTGKSGGILFPIIVLISSIIIAAGYTIWKIRRNLIK